MVIQSDFHAQMTLSSVHESIHQLSVDYLV